MRLHKCFVFAVFCQLVQMFMSYDGGATSASIDKIQSSGMQWTQAELGLLGSLDKFGMTISSVAWGLILQVVPAKATLVLGLAVNSASTLAFGTVNVKAVMFVAKLLMGVTQGLQCVWSTCWILTHAPMSARTVWLGFSAISAGLGNGIGTAVAGFGTSQGLAYAIAWEIEAAALGTLWVILVLCPTQSFAIDHRERDVSACSEDRAGMVDNSNAHSEDPDPRSTEATGSLHSPAKLRQLEGHARNAGNSSGSSWDEAVEQMQLSRRGPSSEEGSRSANVLRSAEAYGELRLIRIQATTNFNSLEAALVVQKDALTQIRHLATNPLYMWTALVLASIFFVTSGVQFLWVRVFINVWGVSKSGAVTAFLLSTGLGGLSGVLIGPRAIDHCGGFIDKQGRWNSLKFIACMMWTSVCGALVCLIVLFAKCHAGTLGSSLSDFWLLQVIWLAHFVIFVGFNASLAGLTGINIGALSPHMRSLGSGCTVSVQNLLGYAMGPLVPGALMDELSYHAPWRDSDPQGAARLLCCGLASVMLGVAAALGCSLAALSVARPTREPLLASEAAGRQP